VIIDRFGELAHRQGMENRHCIKCDEVMAAKVVEEVEVDWCPVCHGLWLDQDEIHELGAKSDAALEELRELVKQQGRDEEAPVGTGRPCPACAGKLTLAILGTFNIEHCTGCGGIFLDRGELDKMMYLTRNRQDRVATIVALARSVVASGVVEQ
jgi:Zn-finger nucleic acid-binding protein